MMASFSVSAEVVEVEEHDLGSDAESEARETLKLTARGRPAHTPTRPRTARDETKKEIQEDDEATLRELLIRYTPTHTRTITSTYYLSTFYPHVPSFGSSSFFSLLFFLTCSDRINSTTAKWKHKGKVC